MALNLFGVATSVHVRRCSSSCDGHARNSISCVQRLPIKKTLDLLSVVGLAFSLLESVVIVWLMLS